ncbi:MAG: N-6 DNA methylase [Myxococcota bacterium]|nr:N-6 DNA methylase [Myxococcota bacterium]
MKEQETTDAFSSDWNKENPTLVTTYSPKRLRALIACMTDRAVFQEDYEQCTVSAKYEQHIEACTVYGYLTEGVHDVVVLDVQLPPNGRSLQANMAQRDFVLDILNNHSKGYSAALVAFFVAQRRSWRFSLVRRSCPLGRESDDGVCWVHRYSFIMDQIDGNRMMQERLQTLHAQALPIWKTCIDWFRPADVQQSFCTQYRSLLLRLGHILESQRATNRALATILDRKGIRIGDLAKGIVKRVTLLYFLRSKGWLSVAQSRTNPQDRDVFGCLFSPERLQPDRQNDVDFYQRVLCPLLYEGLAADRGGASYKVEGREYTVPYLNHPIFRPFCGLDRSNPHYQLHIPNSFFCNGQDGLFDILGRYHFTTREDEPFESTLCVTPEVLERLFEVLLPEEVRTNRGVYYTPKNVVWYMCQESLLAHLVSLNSDLTEGDLRTLLLLPYGVCDDIPMPLQGRLGDIDAQLKTIAVCEPAVGSGAFFIGTLQILTLIRSFIQSQLGIGADLYAIKKEIVGNNLHGVDIDSEALQVVRERSWLSLIDELEHWDIMEKEPPLGYSLWQGNSLQDIDMSRVPNGDVTDDGSKIFRWKRAFSHLFQSKQGGFDIVIGNPPYLKHPDGGDKIWSMLKSNPVFKARCDLWYLFAHLGLTLLKENGVLSFIATNNWLQADGASKIRNYVLQTAQFRKYIDFHNHFLFENAQIQTMIMVLQKSHTPQPHDIRVAVAKELTKHFDRTKQQKMLEELLFLEELPEGQIRCFERFDLSFQPQEWNDKMISFNADQTAKICRRIENARRDRDYLDKKEISQGIAANPPQVTKKAINGFSPAQRRAHNIQVGDPVFIFSVDQIPAELRESPFLKPLYEPTLFRYNGEETPYFCEPYTKKIIYLSHKDTDFQPESEPALIRHLERYRPIMERRRENQNGKRKFYHLHWPKDESFFTAPSKIVAVRKCPKRPIFHYSEKDVYVEGTFNVICSDRINLKYLCAVLNSSLIRFWLRYKGKMQGNAFQVDGANLQDIPIARAQPATVSLLSHLLDGIHHGYQIGRLEPAKVLETLIDVCVFELYFSESRPVSILQRCLEEFTPNEAGWNTVELDTVLSFWKTLLPHIETLRKESAFAQIHETND